MKIFPITVTATVQQPSAVSSPGHQPEHVFHEQVWELFLATSCAWASYEEFCGYECQFLDIIIPVV